MERVHRVVAGQDAIDQRLIAVDKRLDRQAHLFLRQPAHFEEPRLELRQLFFEVADAAFTR